LIHFENAPKYAQAVASIERLKKIAANLKATVIIRHDARDVENCRCFPRSRISCGL
jgi:hypothetical protein